MIKIRFLRESDLYVIKLRKLKKPNIAYKVKWAVLRTINCNDSTIAVCCVKSSVSNEG